MDLSPAEVAKVVSVVSPYTTKIEEDPVTVALAIEDKDFLGKPVLTSTEITNQPEQKKANEKRTKTITYTVEGNDTLSSIGWKYGLKIATIKAVNSLNSDTIKPGQQIKLPPQDLDSSTMANLNKKKIVAGTTSTKKAFAGTFRRPTSGWHVSQVFGHTSFESNHTGIDLDSRSGGTIFASASGTVVRTTRGWGGGYGNHIVIDHGNGFQTLYGHMSSFSVSQGQWVNQGQPIGVMGSTGWSTGVHLHFEIRVNGRPVNPTGYL
ncbi:MAG: peptidoglycan DD-metalloendopeptidase family protein [Patescibacteria group bacterium]|jgi:murein DD-endopeptidase MepM/ murein hydrolase activator NlpD